MPIPDHADREKLAEIGLAILWLGISSDQYGSRAWKSLDWDLTDLLFEKGWISEPKNKNKSVLVTDEGLRLAEQYFEKHFSQDITN